jgi:hypothetical protein
MKEILTCDIWTGVKIKVVIDRETGEFVLFNSRFRLDIQDDQAFLMDRYGDNPLSIGHLYGSCWFFEGPDCIREDEDPFCAVIQFLYDIVQYC